MTLPPAILRDEGGHDFKRAVVNAILNVIEQVSQNVCAVTLIYFEHAYFFAGVLASFCFLKCATSAPRIYPYPPSPQLPESKDMGLGILCEFIEDCEYV